MHRPMKREIQSIKKIAARHLPRNEGGGMIYQRRNRQSTQATYITDEKSFLD